MISEAMSILHPGAESVFDYVFTKTDKGIVCTKWNLPGNPPTEAELQAAFIQWQAEQTPDALDTKALNKALAEDGSVARALAEVMFDEINALRTRAGLSARTKTQFVTALKAKMRG